MAATTRTEKLDLRLTPCAKRVLQSAATAARLRSARLYSRAPWRGLRRPCPIGNASASMPIVGPHSRVRSMPQRVKIPG